ncbi:MAG: hypothetical protein E7294_07840 [Lachnospiraceae bacterium]|nr:hypothetical protein [Lachnospiraceae bacterium]
MSRFKKFAAFAAAMIAAAAVVVGNPQTTKAADIAIQQVAATPTTATVQWAPVAGASYYHVKCAGKEFDTTATSATLTGEYAGYAGQEMTVWIEALKRDSNYRNGVKTLAYDYAYIATKPVATPLLTSWKAGTPNPSMQWIKSCYASPDGYNVQVLDAKGKLIVNATANYSIYYTFSNSKVKNKGFSIRIQPFYTGKATPDGKVYGDWSAYESYVPQPPVTGKYRSNYYTRQKTVVLNWKKVAGAKTYSIYRATKRDGKYKKLATTKKTTFSQGGLKTSQTYYYKVIANKVPIKVNGKKKKLNSYTKTFINYTYV